MNISIDGSFCSLVRLPQFIGSILADGLQNHGGNGLPQSSRRLTVALLRSSSYLFRRTTRRSSIFSSESAARDGITCVRKTWPRCLSSRVYRGISRVTKDLPPLEKLGGSSLRSE